MWILLNYHDLYMKNNRKMPECRMVREATEAYQRSNDNFRAFVDDNIHPVENDQTYIRLIETYQLYKRWMRENCPHDRALTRADLQIKLDRALGVEYGQIRGAPKGSKGWSGYQLGLPEEPAGGHQGQGQGPDLVQYIR